MNTLTDDDLSFILRTLVFHYDENSEGFKQAEEIREKIMKIKLQRGMF